MLNKLVAFIRKYDMLQPGDRVVCAVSGGADSVALLFALYLLREKLQINVHAAHFNHGLRGTESDRDEIFVREFCQRFEIPLYVGGGKVVAGKKGLEAAARDARYAFLRTLSGKIATAHTANDNAETVLMHLVRGTGLKGLGGIAPVNGMLIRPMLSITRQEVETFLQEYHLDYVTDSSNNGDAFLRNRLRHYVMPLLEKENPKIFENVSALAQRLQEDEKILAEQAAFQLLPDVNELQKMPESIRYRCISSFLQSAGVQEPESEHIALINKLVFSNNPSARADLPDGVVITRNYNSLQVLENRPELVTTALPCPSVVYLNSLGIRVICKPASKAVDQVDAFTVVPNGPVVLRSRQAGDTMRLHGGSKELKKLFIDRKIPASQRHNVPVVSDDDGVLGVYGIGVSRDRFAAEMPAVEIRFEIIE